MKLLTRSELEKLPTKRLLAYFKKLRKTYEKRKFVEEEMDAAITCKDIAKSILDTRENVEK